MGGKKDLEIRKRENFKQGVVRLLDTLHNNSAKYIVARSRQHISIHEMRKNIKKTRGITRLLRDEIGKEKYRELNEFYKNIANRIAVLRDDTSQIELLESMKKKINSPELKKPFSSAIRQVEKKRKVEFEKFLLSGQQNSIRGLILDQKEIIHELDFEGDPDYFILESLCRIHRRARSAYEVTTFLPHDEIYHYWRKQVKYLMYQLTIINNAWPSFFKTYINELDKLGNLLGKLHDLSLLNQHVHEKKLIVLNKKQKDIILNYIYKQRAKKKKKIEKTGKRLFTESSEEFAIRVHEIWSDSDLEKSMQ